MRNNLCNISLYIISMTANRSSLCTSIRSNWEIKKRLTDYSELTFFTSISNNLLKHKINCVSLFKLHYMRKSGGMWACVISWTKANWKAPWEKSHLLIWPVHPWAKATLSYLYKWCYFTRNKCDDLNGLVFSNTDS
jgi:hypothetical protein